MEMRRRTFLQGAAATSILSVMGVAGCSNSDSSPSGNSSSSSDSSLAFDGTTWNYDATNDVYWQLGKVYASMPAAKEYETLGVFVPGAYLKKGVKNSDGTYRATLDASGTIGGFTARTAPIVFPVDTPGYAAQKPLTSYQLPLRHQVPLRPHQPIGVSADHLPDGPGLRRPSQQRWHLGHLRRGQEHRAA